MQSTMFSDNEYVYNDGASNDEEEVFDDDNIEDETHKNWLIDDPLDDYLHWLSDADLKGFLIVKVIKDRIEGIDLHRRHR